VRPARLRLAGVAAVALAFVWIAPGGASAGEVRRVEAVGAVALDPDAADRSTPPRDAAMQAGLSEAVRQVALSLLGGIDPLPDEAPGSDPGTGGDVNILAGALGRDPLVYVNGYRIVEDRGVRPALFVADADAENEYVVVVEARVDVDRVQRRLVERGLLAEAPTGAPRRLSLRVSVEGLETHDAYLEVVDALTKEGGARSANPVEASSGRVVFEVEADRDGPELLAALIQARRPGLRITPLQSQDQRLAFRVDWEPPTPADGSVDVAPPD